MALIAVVTFDTPENGRTEMTNRTLASLHYQVDMSKNRVVVCDNGSCEQTRMSLESSLRLGVIDTVFYNNENLGTAKAINRIIRIRRPGEVVIKMDNDVVVNQKDWPQRMEEAFARDPKIGIVGLKRKDLEQRPNHPDLQYRSQLQMLPHKRGEPWIVVEQCEDIMGTCEAFNPRLLDKVGYLYQMGGVYGFDDADMAVRSRLAGFRNVFLPTIDIDHVDPGGTLYTEQKVKYATKRVNQFHRLVDGYRAGKEPLYRCAE
jgi:GT2 family glycosyltransferase